MVFIGSAIGAGGLIGLGTLGAGVAGAGASIWAANKAADVQTNAANQSAQLQREQMQRNQDNMQPFISGGQGASNLLQSFYGIGGSDPALGQSALARFQQSPDYQFALKGGSDALDNSAASKGGMLGGNQIRAQTEYGQGLVSQNLQSYLSRLSGMSGQGIQAGGSIAGANTYGANAAGNSLMAAGTAQASGILGDARAINGTGGPNGGGLLNSLSLYNQMNQSSYPGQTGTQMVGNYSMPKIGF
jgi:hypothetical protein